MEIELIMPHIESWVQCPKCYHNDYMGAKMFSRPTYKPREYECINCGYHRYWSWGRSISLIEAMMAGYRSKEIETNKKSISKPQFGAFLYDPKLLPKKPPLHTNN
jgi:Zn ribbon nucleic-acid-binding protein